MSVVGLICSGDWALSISYVTQKWAFPNILAYGNTLASYMF